MTKEEYIFNCARRLKSASIKRKNLNKRLELSNSLTEKAYKKILSDLDWIAMEVEKDKERLAYVLGCLPFNDLRDEYHPSPWHVYPGIKGEVENIVFD